jgi:GT2 family glycosyltransferase
MFLNPDAALCRGASQMLAAYLAEHPRVAAVGPALAFPDGSAQDAAFTYPSLLMTWLEFFPRPGRLLHGRLNGRLHSPDGRPIDVEHLLGACLLVRPEAWRDVGRFDEDFFLYCEEVDWCMRARQRGWNVSHLPTALVLHGGGASAEQAPGPSLVHLYTSRLRLHRKYRGLPFRVLARFITCVGLAQERRRLWHTESPSRADRLAALERAMRLAHR